MIAYKKGMSDKKREKTVETDTPLSKMVGSSHQELIEMYEQMDKESVLDKKFGWYCTLDIPEKEGVKCKIYQRPIPGRSIKMCRNDTV